MVTGDNIQTAVAIATECGIYQEGGTAIEGKDFRVMTPEEQYEVLPNVQVRIGVALLPGSIFGFGSLL